MNTTYIEKIQKDKHNKITKSSKYYLSSCQERIENDINKNTREYLVINTIIKENTIFQGIYEQYNKVVLKVGQNNDFIRKEYDISKYFYDNDFDGFVKFICKFSCNDKIEKYSKIDKEIEICDKNGNIKVYFLLMNDYYLGSIKNYKWTHDNVNILKKLLKITLKNLFNVSINTGFIHKDFHADNIMIILKNNEYRPIIIDLEMGLFIGNDKIHKDYIYRGSDKDKPIEKLLSIYDLRKLFGSLLDLPNSTINLNVSYILSKLYNISDKVETTFEMLYELFPMIDNINYN